ncbi:MAG TPA: hypothetical protein VLD18_15390 [Verrucomicrobiae bacterium]|nr:hypothetical protein [Verrucomicrobiae bacterium]
MKTKLLGATVLLLAGSLLAADVPAELKSAFKKLGDASNYSWKTTVTVPEGSRFRPGPTEGKAEKDGYTHLSMTVANNTTQALMKGNKAAATDQDGDWQSLEDLENSEGRARFLAGMLRSFKPPASQAASIAETAKELKKDGDSYAGDLTEEGARDLMRFRRGGDGPTISGAKGSVKFWVRDGTLSKYEFKVQGKMDFNGNEIEIDRTTTVEVKDVGTTKLEIPAEAKKKVS